MSIYRVIKFFTCWLSKKRLPSLSRVDRIPSREQKSNLRRFIDNFLGRSYRLLQFQKEKFRVWRFNRLSDLRGNRITLEIIKHSKKLIFFIILFFIGTTCLDYGVDYLNSIVLQRNWLKIVIGLPSYDFIELLLEIFIGAIAVVLGLIFALYSVGFQASTEKYTESVSSYINREPVGNYFFRLLIFTEIYNILLLIRLQFISVFPYSSFIISFLLVGLSLLGIVIFKDHYLVSIKPKSLFERMWSEFLEGIEVVSKRKSSFFKSWSIIRTTQIKVERLITTFFDLCDDLIRDKKLNEASIGIVIVGNILRDYVEKKRYIDTKYSWWFPEKYELVKATDMHMYSIKAHFEKEGKGILHLPKPNYSWLEDRILRRLEKVQRESDTDTDEQLLTGLIEGYKIILSGVALKDEKGKGLIAKGGAYQEQEFEVFEKCLKQFLNLSEKFDLNNENVLTDYINAYFTISHFVLEGFKWDLLEIPLRKLGGLKRETVEDLKLPSLFRQKLIDYHERLEVETELEGEIVTPIGWWEKEVTDILAQEEKHITDKYLQLFIDDSNKMIKRFIDTKNNLFLAHFMKVQYNWLNTLVCQDKIDLAEDCVQKISSNTFYIMTIGKETLETVELLEYLEYGVFPAVIRNNTILSKNYFRAITDTVIMLCRNEKNPEIVIEKYRLFLIIGGLTYLVAEFKQDFSVLKEYTKHLVELNGILYKKGHFLDFFEALQKYNPTQLMFTETTKYHLWFVDICQQIDALPKMSERKPGMFVCDEVARHPSQFIRELSVHGLYEEESCIEGFIEWLKKREQIKEIITILNQIQQ